MSTVTAPQARTAARPALIAAAGAGVAAAIANIAVLFAGNALIDGDVQVTDGPGSSTYTDLTAGQVGIATLVAALLAGLAWIVIGRFAAGRVRGVFLGITAVALVLSFGGPLGLDIPGSQQLILSVMHVVTAAAVAVALPLRRG